MMLCECQDAASLRPLRALQLAPAMAVIVLTAPTGSTGCARLWSVSMP
jgi:hypothetical protein